MTTLRPSTLKSTLPNIFSQKPPLVPPIAHPRGVYKFWKRVYTDKCFCLNPDMIKDYAHPTMMAERALKDLHDAVLDKNLEKALEKSKEAAKWIWEIQEALVEMKEKG